MNAASFLYLLLAFQFSRSLDFSFAVYPVHAKGMFTKNRNIAIFNYRRADDLFRIRRLLSSIEFLDSKMITNEENQ